MWCLNIFLLGLITVACQASASDIITLNATTFNDFVSEHDVVLAEFFAPWCRHCATFAPEYESAATSLKQKNIPLVQVNCVEEAALCKELGVIGYPNITMFRGPEKSTFYPGARTASAIISYMSKQMLPLVSVLTAGNIEKFRTGDKMALVAYFNAQDKASEETFLTFAESIRGEVLIGATNDIALAETENISQPAIILYKDFDDGKDVFEGEINGDGLKLFFQNARIPLIGEISLETFDTYLMTGKPIAYIIADTVEEQQVLVSALKPVAQKYKDAINLVTLNVHEQPEVAGMFELEAGRAPHFVIQDIDNFDKFPFDRNNHEITSESIDQFIQEYTFSKTAATNTSNLPSENEEMPENEVRNVFASETIKESQEHNEL